MAALTANAVGLSHQGYPTIIGVKTTAGTFYKGALVCFDVTNGTVINGTNAGFAAGDIFAGIVVKYKVTTTADPMVEIAIDGVWSFANANIALTDCGEPAFIGIAGDSDNPADVDVETDAAANDICCGRVLVADGTTCSIDIAQRAANVVGA